MFPDQFLAMKNMPRKIRESLLMLLPTYVCVPCDSHAHGLCTLRTLLMHVACALLVHAACAHPVRFSCVQPM